MGLLAVAGLVLLERRAAEVLLLIREAFLRGLSTRAVGRVVALITQDAVSAQTVSRLTRALDRGGGAVPRSRVAGPNDGAGKLDSNTKRLRRVIDDSQVACVLKFTHFLCGGWKIDIARSAIFN